MNKERRKKAMALILSALLICGAGAAAVYAAGSDTDGSDTDSSETSFFTDIPSGAWYEEAVNWCYDNGVMNGTGGTNFSPDTDLSRAMLSTVLYRQAGSPAVTGTNDFTDVKDGEYYSSAILWVNREGILTGYGDGRFGTDDPVTREQLVTILWRMAGSPAAAQGQPYADQSSVASYAETAVVWAREQNLVNVRDGNLFAPQDYATRAEIAAVLMNYAKAAQAATSPAPDAGGDAKLEVVVGDDVFTATLADTEAAREFAQMLPMTISMSDYGGFEKVGSLGKNLTADNSQITTVAGDIVLYNGNNIVMFYGSNSWSYTRLGKIDDLTGWASALGSGGVNITFRLTNGKTAQAPSADTRPVVYMITDITPESLLAVYEKLNWQPEGKVAVKLSTGEPPASNYLRPELIKDLVQSVNGTIVECNTAYGGSRAQTAMHYQVAKDHGFTDIAEFQILDENGSMTLPVSGGSVLTENYVGKAFADYDSYLILSHFKGHSMAGYGGAIKNISIGLGSSEGKAWIHSGGTSRTNAWGGKQDAFLEAMAEAGKSVADYLGNGKGIVYVNVMNRLSVDCDCDGHPAEPDIHDIGILASTDPVALDQACVDLIYTQKDGDGASLVSRIESRNGLHTLEHAEEIGLGSRTYNLVNIDA